MPQKKSVNEKDWNKKDTAKLEFKAACYICDEVGHKAMNCPLKESIKKKKSAMATTIEGGIVRRSTSPDTMNASSFVTFNALMISKEKWLKKRILLDNQSQGHVFCNEDFIQNIRDKKEPVIYNGLGSHPSHVTSEGLFKTIPVDFNPQLRTNILSCSTLRADGYKYGYDVENDSYWLQVNDEMLHFGLENGLYTYNPYDEETQSEAESEDSEAEDEMFTGTTTLTMQERQGIETARIIEKRLGFPSSERLVSAIQSGALIDTPITAKDIRLGEKYLGKQLPFLQGKSTQHQH